MTKLLHAGAFVCAATLIANPSRAGERIVKHVSISEDPEALSWASGNLGDVFNSTSTVESIGCEVRGSNYVHGLCFARDQKGQTLQCHSMEETTIRAMFAINGDSTVTFGVDRLGKCIAVNVINTSTAAPKRQTTPDSDPTAQGQGGGDVLEIK